MDTISKRIIDENIQKAINNIVEKKLKIAIKHNKKVKKNLKKLKLRAEKNKKKREKLQMIIDNNSIGIVKKNIARMELNKILSKDYTSFNRKKISLKVNLKKTNKQIKNLQ